jgi:hypothetical protein
MKFAHWKRLRETAGPESDTTSFHPGQHNQGFKLGRGASFGPSAGTNNWEKLIEWYNYHYQNYGGWEAIEKQAENDQAFKASLDKLKHEAETLKPKVEPGGFDDEDAAVERWIDKVTQDLVSRMREKGHGYWEKQADQATTRALGQPAQPTQPPQDYLGATRSFHSGLPVPAPPPGDQEASVFGSKIQSLEDRMKRMEELLTRLKPELFRST